MHSSVLYAQTVSQYLIIITAQHVTRATRLCSLLSPGARLSVCLSLCLSVSVCHVRVLYPVPKRGLTVSTEHEYEHE